MKKKHKLTISLTDSQLATLTKWAGTKRKCTGVAQMVINNHIISLVNLEKIQELKLASDAVANLERKVQEMKQP